jgi:hypothetical protein
MTITPADIEAHLREALPDGLKPQAAALAQLLADAANGSMPEARARFAAEPAFAAAVEALAGKRVGPVLSFGEGNQIGEVTVGDVAGGSVLKFEVLPIGGDVVRSIIVQGDRNRVFAGDYERLRDAYISPWSVFQRLKLERFVGRKWLIQRVDAFLRENDRGFFILEAAAGLGKTAFLAHLVRMRGYIHLFAEQARGQDGIAPGLRSLAAQVIRAWSLKPYFADDVLPRAAVRPDFLESLLVEAARQRDLRRPGEPIVLVVDGLDEAGTLPGHNVLGLPRVLPRGVYLFVSHRPVPVSLTVEKPRRRYALQAEADPNLKDMRRYLKRAVSWPGITQALRESGDDTERFITLLLEKCRGVWIYLHYILEEIERGERRPLDLNRLA